MSDDLKGRLTQARGLRGWNQLELATESGVSAAQISRYESGRSKPRTEVLAKLSRALDVPLEWLMNGAKAQIDKSLEPFWDKSTPWIDTSARNEIEASIDPATQKKGAVFSYVDPIDIDSEMLMELALRLTAYHAERAALQAVVERMDASQVPFTVSDGTKRQLKAVEADILDVQLDLRKLLAED